MAKNLVSIDLDNTEYSLRPYGTCSTAATTTAKTVAITDFELFTGATVCVKFTNTNTATTPTLNVNSTGAKIIKIDKPIKADEVYEFIYDGTNWVHLNNNSTDLKYFKYFTPDNGGRTTFTLIAKLDKWKVGTSSNYYLIGTMYGQRGGNMSRTGIYNIVAQAVSYSTSATQKLYVTDYPSQGCVMPYIVAYTKDGVTENYLALRKTGSGDNIYFQGLMGGLLPQNEWIELNVQSGADLPEDMTIVASPGVNQAHITTEKYFDGSNTRTLLHSGNYSQYANKYELPAATNSALGGIKIGYTQSGKNYPVLLDSNNKAYVNVPWTDTDTNTDTKVTQTVTTANANYPLLLAPTGQTATTTTTSYFDSGVTLNPYTNILDGAKVYESLLQWGNTAIAGSLSPLDVAMDSQWSANRLSFMPASGINIEYSTDGGTTWSDYGVTDEEKRSLVTTGLSYSLSLGKNTTRQKINSDRVRVTITAESGKTYFSLKKIYMYISQNGANSCKVLIEKAQCGSDTTFVQVGEYSISGWSGWNSIPLTANFGGGDDQTANIRRLRFTYYFTAYGTGYGETDDKSAVKWTISKLNMIGETSWRNSGGNLSATGHIYSYDINKNVTFPANLTSTGSLTVKGHTTLGDTTTDTITIKGKTIIEEGAGLVIKGTGSVNHIMARGVRGSDGAGLVGPLYLQYGANKPVYFGDGGSYHISADGSQYSGNALTATDIKSGNIATAAEITALFN